MLLLKINPIAVNKNRIGVRVTKIMKINQQADLLLCGY